MLNQLVVVGRITKDPELNKTESGKSVSNITIAVPRNFKNSEGAYDTDFIDVTLWNGIADNTFEYVKQGDIIGVKGRVESIMTEKEDGYKKNELSVVAEKVTFLSSKAKEAPEPER